MKSKDQRQLYSTTTFTFENGHGHNPEPEDDFFVTQRTDKGWVRGQGVFDAEPPSFNKNYDTSISEDIKVPFISHEIGQYAVYPNLKEIDKYTGTLLPLNLMAIRQDMSRKGLINDSEHWFNASGELAVILYKEEIERALKTKRQSGFQLLGLQDFSGQSTALVGLVDAFWDNKGFISPDSFRQFCSPIVPLANFDKAVYTNDDTFKAELLIANYGNESLTGKRIRWTLGEKTGTIRIDNDEKGLISVGKIEVPLSSIGKARKLTLTSEVENSHNRNSWDIWIYPKELNTNTSSVVVTRDFTEAVTALRLGKNVLLSPSIKDINGLEGKFVPVFWSPIHFPKQAGTMGILCDTSHPALTEFPTESHSNWQCWNLLRNAKVFNTDSINVTPIVTSIDNFANNRRLSVVFEARCGKGKLIMTSLDLLDKSTKHPEARQLVNSLVEYMKSEYFNPKENTSETQVTSLKSDNEDIEQSDATDIYK